MCPYCLNRNKEKNGVLHAHKKKLIHSRCVQKKNRLILVFEVIAMYVSNYLIVVL